MFAGRRPRHPRRGQDGLLRLRSHELTALPLSRGALNVPIEFSHITGLTLIAAGQRGNT
jgi:hypothetical protein